MMTTFRRRRTTRPPVPEPAPPDHSARQAHEHEARALAKIAENALFRGNWNYQGPGLIPQLKRRHISMISIGGAIGTGVFLGSGEALKNGGAAGILLGYSVMGSVVYCLVVSVGEMVSFLPNLHGPVGLADKYVDEALGFAMGWNAWYHWTIVLPTELSAARALLKFWHLPIRLEPLWCTLMLIFAIGVNCVGVGRYGEIEFWFSSLKVVALLMILIVGVVLDAGGGAKGRIGVKNWEEPFPQYLDIPGGFGRFLGFFAVLIQAAFSYFGSELPGVVVGEVINAQKAVYPTLKRTCYRIILFYVSGVFIAGLLVPSNHERLEMDNSEQWVGSPFIIALQEAGSKWRILPHLFIALFLSSAWSAAAADVFVSSRYLYFLAKRGHAPAFMGFVYSNASRQARQFPRTTTLPATDSIPPTLGAKRDVEGPLHAEKFSTASTSDPHLDHEENSASVRELPTSTPVPLSASTVVSGSQPLVLPNVDILPQTMNEISPGRTDEVITIPWVGILVAAGVGVMSFMPLRGSNKEARSPEQAFTWLSTMVASASLQSWIGMLWTYLRWYEGTRFREERNKLDPRSARYSQEIKEIKTNRHLGQPWLARYALFMCFLVLFFHGWSILKTGHWKVYQRRDDATFDQAKHSDNVTRFITYYIPIPIFLLLAFGYKLINQTKMVLVEDMKFSRDPQAARQANVTLDQPPKEWYQKPFWFLFS